PGVGLPELRMASAEVQAFGGAAGGAVLGIEVQNDLLALECGELHGLAAGGFGLEFGNGLVKRYSHDGSLNMGFRDSAGARVRSAHPGSARRRSRGTGRAAS